MMSIDSFVVYALIAGLSLALVAGPLGCVVVWRRMAYFGDTLSHAALLGIAIAISVDMLPMVGVALVGVAAVEEHSKADVDQPSNVPRTSQDS